MTLAILGGNFVRSSVTEKILCAMVELSGPVVLATRRCGPHSAMDLAASGSILLAVHS